MNHIRSNGAPGKLMVIGDFPSQPEYLEGRAFSTSTGHWLDGLLRDAGYDDSPPYRTHLYKIPIVGYGSSKKADAREAIEAVKKLDSWESIINEEIQMANPNLIITCGELAMQAMTGKTSIHKWRGSPLGLSHQWGRPNVNVVPIHSFRECKEQSDKPIIYTIWDVQKALTFLNYSTRHTNNEKIWIVRNSSEFSNWWDRSCRGEFLTFDIETHFGCITCISFCVNGKEAISVPLLIGPTLDNFQRGFYYKLIREILTHPIPKVNQNINYDMTILEHYGFKINNVVGDTLHMAHTIYPELPKDLGFLTSIWTKFAYYKDEGRKYDPRIHNVEQFFHYNAMDALVTWQIWTAQQPDAEAQGTRSFYFNYVHPTFFTYRKMDKRGLRIDEAQKNKLNEKYIPEYDKLCTWINMVAEENVNLNSPQQVSRFIYDILGCPKKASGTKLGTDKDSLEELFARGLDQTRTDVVKRVILARKYYRIIQFINSPLSVDGTSRTTYRLTGTENGRTSASKSLDSVFGIKDGKIKQLEVGFSRQTMPKHGWEFGDIRIGADLLSMFVPSPGYCFVSGDGAQAEDRVVCVLADDLDGLAILDKPKFVKNKHGMKDDRHTLTAMLITGKPFEEITTDDRQLRGKKPRHAGNYNMGPGMLSILTHLLFGECSRIMDKFHSDNPKIRGVFHTLIRHLLNKQKFLVSPHGRRRDFFGMINEDMVKEALSMIPQATVSDHNKFALLAPLDRDWINVYPIIESHDSCTFEVPLDEREAFMDDFRKKALTPIDFNQCSISRDVQIVIPWELSWTAENLGALK